MNNKSQELTTTFPRTAHFAYHLSSSPSSCLANEPGPSYAPSSTWVRWWMSMHHSEWSFNIVKLSLISSEGNTYLTRLHSPNRLVLGVMRDIRSTMEEIVDTVTTIRSDDRTAVCSCNRFAAGYDCELLVLLCGERRDGNRWDEGHTSSFQCHGREHPVYRWR